jgi:cytochrome P450
MSLDLFPKFNGEMLTKSSLGYRFAARPNIALLNGEHWKSQRKIANPAFHRSMPVQLFGKLAEDLFDEMDKMKSRVEVTDLMARWTLDAIGKAGFGKFIEIYVVLYIKEHVLTTHNLHL